MKLHTEMLADVFELVSSNWKHLRRQSSDNRYLNSRYVQKKIFFGPSHLIQMKFHDRLLLFT